MYGPLRGNGRVDLAYHADLDKSDLFAFGFSKLDILFGRKKPDAVRHYYRDIVKPGVTFRQETITAIDPESRRVTTGPLVVTTPMCWWLRSERTMTSAQHRG